MIMLCLGTYLNMMTMKIGLDVLPRIRKRGMNYFLLSQLCSPQMFFN